MSDKIARLGIERDNDLMYYIKNGDVWATPRKQPGRPKGKAQKVAATGLELDYSKYLYFLDRDGDVARKVRALGGGGRRAKTKKTPRSAISGHYVTEATAKRHPKMTVTDTVEVKADRKSGRRAKTKKTPRSAISGHYVTEATAKRHPKTTVTDTIEVRPRRGKKSPEQLDREIDECLAQVK